MRAILARLGGERKRSGERPSPAPRAVSRNLFNPTTWKPALAAAGIPTRHNGTHALRHHFASVLLHAGVDIRALSEYLGHHDPGFTLRTYTHLMPAAHDRMRVAIDRAAIDSGPGGQASGDAQPRTAAGPVHGPATAREGAR